MTIHEAADLLNSKFLGADWLTAVGVGLHDDEEVIYLYVSRQPRNELKILHDGWHGFRVLVRKMGVVRPIKVYSPHKPIIRSRRGRIEQKKKRLDAENLEHR